MSLQVENGQYTRIVNEVLEQLVKVSLLGSEYQIVLFVIRKTWGFNKKDDIISLSQFELATDLSRPTVIKTIKNLVKMKMLVKVSSPDRQQIAYRFNKYWKEWVVNTPLLVKYKDTTSKIQAQKLVKVSLHTKDITKENKREINLEGLKAYKRMKERWGKKE